MICEDYPMRPLPFSLTGLVAVTCLFAANLRADVTPAALFCDHAVLQQGMPLPIWGTATDGETVTVTLAGQTASTIAKDGRWLVRLAPVTAGGPYQLVIAGRNRVECNDVMVGEVWLCSGQSNMEMKLGPVDGMQPVINWQEAVATSDQPEVRFFTVPRVHSLTPPVSGLGRLEAEFARNLTQFQCCGFFLWPSHPPGAPRARRADP